jgi:MFS family permease
MTNGSLINYYVGTKFNLPKSTLGDVVSVAYLLSAFSATLAGPLSNRIGLVNTMVFTHLPSSVCLGLVPAPNNVPMTVALLFFRALTSSMDQAPRAAFVAAVVKPEERTAVMGINSMLRTAAQSSGPTITGLLAGSDRFWVAFAVASLLRVIYDLGLWTMCINMKLYRHEPPSTKPGTADRRDSGFDEESGAAQQ